MVNRAIQIPRGKVKRSVNARIKDLHRLARSLGDRAVSAYAKMVREERQRYARVRVVEGFDGARLVYPGTPEGDGTGPFETVAKAHAWFLSGGR